jgi:opacity protein-like surface antigen
MAGGFVLLAGHSSAWAQEGEAGQWIVEAAPDITAVNSDTDPVLEFQYQIAASEGTGARAPDEWTFYLLPYLWVPVSVDGDSTVDGGTVELDLDLSDVLDLLEFGISGRVEAWKGDFGFILDSWYVDLGLDVTTPGPGIDVDIQQGQIDLLLGYQAGRWPVGAPDSETEAGWKPHLFLDLMGGGRYVHLKQEITFSPGPDLGGDKDWIEPVIGARLVLEATERISFVARADASGFGVPEASDLTWNFLAGIGYHPWERASIGAGYRVYSIDYSDGDGADEFGFDATMHGPYLTFVYQF